jgi:hypothetical protein
MRAVAQLLAGRGGEEVLCCGALRLRLEMVVGAMVVAFSFSVASLVEGRSCRGGSLLRVWFGKGAYL